jgi:hypothetical protein
MRREVGSLGSADVAVADPATPTSTAASIANARLVDRISLLRFVLVACLGCPNVLLAG